MSQQAFDVFRAKLATDETLREEMSRVLGSNGTPEGLAAFARERGYDFSSDEIKKAVDELSDEDLDDVAGGTSRLLQACAKGKTFKAVVIHD